MVVQLMMELGRGRGARAYQRTRVKQRLHQALVGAALVVAGCTSAGDTEFYEGKRITALINFSAGGTTDIEARIFARHLGKHIPGKPDVIARNMPGAGGISAINYMSDVAAPDGLTAAIFAIPMTQQLLDAPGLRADLSEFVWLAGMVGPPQVCIIRKDAGGGINRVDDLPGIDEFSVGGLSPTSSVDVKIRLALDLLGTRYRYVTGYRGNANVFVAVMQNEVQFTCGNTSFFGSTLEPNLIEPGLAIPLWYFPVVDPDGGQVQPEQFEGIPTYGDVHERLRGDEPSGLAYEALQLINNLSLGLQFGSFLPEGTPDDAVEALRLAWEALATDEQFIADYLNTTGGPPNLLTATEARALVERLGAADPEIVDFIKELIEN